MVPDAELVGMFFRAPESEFVFIQPRQCATQERCRISSPFPYCIDSSVQLRELVMTIHQLDNSQLEEFSYRLDPMQLHRC